MIPQGNYKYTIQYSDCTVHGQSPSSDWPEIAADFYIQFWRDPNDKSKLWWDTSSFDWSYDNGHFGYQFQAAIAVNPANKYYPDWDTELYTIIEKTYTGDDGNNWWAYANHAGGSLPAPGPHYVTSTNNNPAKLYIYVKERQCQHYEDGSYVYCFNDGKEWYLVNEISLDIPPYSIPYTISYATQDGPSGRSGSPIPSPYTTDSLGVMLDGTVPTLPLYIGYHFDTTQTVTVNKVFNNWKCDFDQQIYAPRAIYRGQTTTTFRAQWGDATFTPLAIPDEYFTLTYQCNGGTTTPSSVQLVRDTNGYATSSGSTTKEYTPGVAATTPYDLNLYPIYQNAHVIYANLPTPTKAGSTFEGWYKDSALTQKITSDYDISANTTIYAKWAALPLYQLNNQNEWGSIGPYVWRFNGSEWQPIAHILKFDGTTWIDLSQ